VNRKEGWATKEKTGETAAHLRNVEPRHRKCTMKDYPITDIKVKRPPPNIFTKGTLVMSAASGHFISSRKLGKASVTLVSALTFNLGPISGIRYNVSFTAAGRRYKLPLIHYIGEASHHITRTETDSSVYYHGPATRPRHVFSFAADDLGPPPPPYAANNGPTDLVAVPALDHPLLERVDAND
jgi:hypothetical protein